MLTRLLALIKEGDLHASSELAAALGTSREMVDAMLADLQRRGMIATLPSGTATACRHCPRAGHCPTH